MTPLEWLDHGADAGFRVTGRSLAEVFCEAARGLFALMLDIEQVRPSIDHCVELRAGTRRQLLVDWLSDLLAQKDVTGLVFGRFEVTISGDEGTGFAAHGQAHGERLDPRRHHPGTEVKGISYLGLEVCPTEDGWLAQVVVDV
jgi:SHS2 domain-containing protein